ncbi:hypothetical protein ACGFOU_18865 [Streptomyces sp. NPDC048595]|uniref:hypothetical protein n=1 Tax=Streptomyces sp. NPDC048595 TaxID=3365576 RepID=UPI00371B0C3F
MAGSEETPLEEEILEALDAVRQLHTLAPHLWAESANAMRDAVVSGDMVGRDKNIGVHFHGGPAGRHVVGPVPARERRSIGGAFAPSRRYDEAFERLRRDRLLVLRGPQESGRRTAGIRLLDQLCGERRSVIAVDPATEPARLAELLRPGHGHVLCDPLTSQDDPLREVHLHAVRDRLRDLGNSYLVITVDAETVLDGGEPVDWEAPSGKDVVVAHLGSLLSFGSGGVRQSEAELLSLEPVCAYLDGRPTPREAAGFARLLAGVARGEVEAEQLTGYGRAARRSTLESWFSGQRAELRDQAFLLSLSTFDGAPYPLIAETGDALFQKLARVEDPDRPVGMAVFGPSRLTRMEFARARETVSAELDRWGAPKQPGVAFQDAGMWSAVLEYVWAEHPAARRPLTAWLRELGQDSRSAVRVRAAVTVGTLACHDFAGMLDSFVAPWARADLLSRRQLAAWALVAAAERGAGSAVHGLLREWSCAGSERRRWTVVRAHAVLGEEAPGAAVWDLGLIADRGAGSDSVLHRAIVQTLETLLIGSSSSVVLVLLAEWLSQEGRSPLARAAFLRAVPHFGEFASQSSTLPVWLEVIRTDAPLQRALVTFWRRVLGDRQSQREALQALGSWVRAAQMSADDERSMALLLSLLPATELERNRLDHLLRTMADNEGQPLLVAVRLRSAVRDTPVPAPGGALLTRAKEMFDE